MSIENLRVSWAGDASDLQGRQKAILTILFPNFPDVERAPANQRNLQRALATPEQVLTLIRCLDVIKALAQQRIAHKGAVLSEATVEKTLSSGCPGDAEWLWRLYKTSTASKATLKKYMTAQKASEQARAKGEACEALEAEVQKTFSALCPNPRSAKDPYPLFISALCEAYAQKTVSSAAHTNIEAKKVLITLLNLCVQHLEPNLEDTKLQQLKALSTAYAQLKACLQYFYVQNLLGTARREYALRRMVDTGHLRTAVFSKIFAIPTPGDPITLCYRSRVVLQGKPGFTDCTETALRNMVGLALSDGKTLGIRQPINSDKLAPQWVQFLKEEPFFWDSAVETHSRWSVLCQQVPGVVYKDGSPAVPWSIANTAHILGHWTRQHTDLPDTEDDDALTTWSLQQIEKALNTLDPDRVYHAQLEPTINPNASCENVVVTANCAKCQQILLSYTLNQVMHRVQYDPIGTITLSDHQKVRPG